MRTASDRPHERTDAPHCAHSPPAVLASCHGEGSTVSDVEAGGDRKVKTLGLFGGWCTGGKFGNVGVAIDGSDKQDCTYAGSIGG